LTSSLVAANYMRKAKAAVIGARLLLKTGDTDGACSRAYYAMFDAAHAALFATGIEDGTAPIKTHNGLIAKFGQHLVLGGHLAATHGEALNAVQRLRQMADYTGDRVSENDATWVLEKAESFLNAVGVKFLDKEGE
jgi:uncharacterized protein (UPF0332 family)